MSEGLGRVSFMNISTPQVRELVGEENANLVVKARPFLKWAGGKTQLLPDIERYLPFNDGKITKYAEPFVGAGAVLFHVLNNYSLRDVYISDINVDLIDTYVSIRDDVEALIDLLTIYEIEYLELSDEARKHYFLEKRSRFNVLKAEDVYGSKTEKSALMIFLNRTCFNGLYRVNARGFYNVPAGRYKNPTICDASNLRAVSAKLAGVKIACAAYTQSDSFIDDETFVYFDPPYRPLTKTAAFTSYTSCDFGDREQIELARFYERMSDRGARCLLSNSDPKNIDPHDNFFDDLFAKYDVRRVYASRAINSKGSARGKITELLISNF